MEGGERWQGEERRVGYLGSLKELRSHDDEEAAALLRRATASVPWRATNTAPAMHGDARHVIRDEGPISPQRPSARRREAHMRSSEYSEYE